jgi:hypothetical protein
MSEIEQTGPCACKFGPEHKPSAHWYNQPPPVRYADHEREVMAAIEERDALHDVADALAAAIAPPEVLGEHSSTNDPWQNALDYAASRTDLDDLRGAVEDVLALVSYVGNESTGPEFVACYEVLAAITARLGGA